MVSPYRSALTGGRPIRSTRCGRSGVAQHRMKWAHQVSSRPYARTLVVGERRHSHHLVRTGKATDKADLQFSTFADAACLRTRCTPLSFYAALPSNRSLLLVQKTLVCATDGEDEPTDFQSCSAFAHETGRLGRLSNATYGPKTAYME